MSAYRVVVRNSPNWRNHKAATLGVSVPSLNWQGNKFESILQFAAEHCDLIRIDVTDALYRHHYLAEGLNASDAMARANAMGALWLTQHQDTISKCVKQVQIIRWAEWYNHSDYAETLAGFEQAYDQNEILRAAVMQDVMEFHRRKNTVPTTAEVKAGRDYLIEELAVITLQARELPSLKIYPGDELACFRFVRQGPREGIPSGLGNEQFAKIKFEKRPPAITASAQMFAFSEASTHREILRAG